LAESEDESDKVSAEKMRGGKRSGRRARHKRPGNKLYEKAKANLNKQLAKIIQRLRRERGEPEDKASEVEDPKEREKDLEGQDDLLPYWKLQTSQDISRIAAENALLDRLRANPSHYSTLFDTQVLHDSLHTLAQSTKNLHPISYYDNQLRYLRRAKELSKALDPRAADLFERLDEEPSTANTTQIEEVLASAIGVGRGTGRGPRKRRKKFSTMLENGGDLSLSNVKRVVGIKPCDIEQIRKYQIRPWKLPRYSDKFDKVDTMGSLFGGGERLSRTIFSSHLIL
jgi:hypothetical protein